MMKRKFKKYYNGKIFTSAKRQRWVEVVITKGAKIIYTGSEINSPKLNLFETEFVDLKGRLMLPGFIDSHLHLSLGGMILSQIDLSKATSIEEFQKILSAFIRENDNELYLGGNWRLDHFKNNEIPNKHWIDEIIPDKPVFLQQADLHMGVANSLALKLGGISRFTPNPNGGIIVKDSVDGEPTGLLKESAMNLILDRIPPLTFIERQNIISNAIIEINRFGITSVTELDDGENLEVFKNLFRSGNLNLRVNYVPLIESVETYDNFIIPPSSYNHLLSRIAVKAFIDGSIGSSTAWFFDPYEDDSNNTGLPTDNFSNGNLEKYFHDAFDNEIQLIVHAIGDKANSELLNMYNNLLKKDSGENRRLRIEHCQHLESEDTKKFSRLNVIASVQPRHLFYDVEACETRLGTERSKMAYTFKSLLKNNTIMVFGSDWPVVTPNVLEGISSAVTREYLNSNGKSWNPEQIISVEDAVRAYTINGAYATLEENTKGSIEVDKFADFTIVEENIFTLTPNEIKDVKVISTILNGDVIYEI